MLNEKTLLQKDFYMLAGKVEKCLWSLLDNEENE